MRGRARSRRSRRLAGDHGPRTLCAPGKITHLPSIHVEPKEKHVKNLRQRNGTRWPHAPRPHQQTRRRRRRDRPREARILQSCEFGEGPHRGRHHRRRSRLGQAPRGRDDRRGNLRQHGNRARLGRSRPRVQSHSHDALLHVQRAARAAARFRGGACSDRTRAGNARRRRQSEGDRGLDGRRRPRLAVCERGEPRRPREDDRRRDLGGHRRQGRLPRLRHRHGRHDHRRRPRAAPPQPADQAHRRSFRAARPAPTGSRGSERTSFPTSSTPTFTTRSSRSPPTRPSPRRGGPPPTRACSWASPPARPSPPPPRSPSAPRPRARRSS